MEEDKKALRDSGERTQYQSGAVRDRKSGKGRYDLTCPHADFREARVFEKGAEKYAERNWEKGMPVMNFLDSAKRHLNQLLEGDQLEDHAAQARWNISCYMETLYRIEKGELPESFDNRPPRMKPNYIPPYIPPAVMKEAADLLAETTKPRELNYACGCPPGWHNNTVSCKSEAMKHPGVADIIKLQEDLSKSSGGTTKYSLPPGTVIQ